MWQLTYRWAKYRHPNKPKRWIVGRYFGRFSKFRNDHWVFGHRESGGHLVKFYLGKSPVSIAEIPQLVERSASRC